MYTFALQKTEIVILSILLSLIVLFLPYSVFVGVVLLLLVVIFTKSKNSNLLLIPVIIGYISVTSEFFESIRIVINIVCTFLLLYLFLKNYGLKYSKCFAIPNGLSIFFTLLFITLLISTVFSGIFIISLFAFLRTIFFFVIIFLFFALTRDEFDIKIIAASLLIVMIILGIPMLIDLYNLGFEYYFLKTLLRDKISQYTSKGYTGVTILFISSSLITSMFFWNKLEKVKYKILLMILLIFNIIFLILANSRGGILASIISASFILFNLKRRIFIRSFLTISAFLFLLYLIIPAFNDAINFYMRWETVGDREEYWQMGLDVISDNSYFGIGPDLFDKYFFNYATSKTLDFYKLGNLSLGKPHPHNFFLYFTAENGILGLITSLTFFVIIFYYSFNTLKITKDKNNVHYIFALAITGIGLGNFFRAFIEVEGFMTYGYITNDLPLWLILVILFHIYQQYNTNLPNSRISEINEN